MSKQTCDTSVETEKQWLEEHQVEIRQRYKELAGVKAYLHKQKLLPLKTVVEIGSWSGGSMFVWASMVEPGGHLIAVDPWTNTEIGGMLGSLAYDKAMQVFDELRARGYNVTVVRKFSQEAREDVERALDGRPTDMLHIDGDHQYEPARQDWDTYSKLVRPGGVVLIHDAANPRQPGVTKLVSELKVERMFVDKWKGVRDVGIALIRMP